ncbi:MAG: PIN domain-containing protein [Chitinispirillales bacterium]|jgi:predicted nucleic acid-binding protein|nr:PIN domain-containing protein [Chitinispirillales bacterium]
MKIYLDTCCYCRPFDLQRQTQTKVETEAVFVESIIELCKIFGFDILGSVILATEIKRICNIEKRRNVLTFYKSTINERAKLSADVVNRAQEINAQGIKAFDAYHIALAETAQVDYLLTVDEKLERTAEKLTLTLKVINPLMFLPEVSKWAQT